MYRSPIATISSIRSVPLTNELTAASRSSSALKLTPCSLASVVASSIVASSRSLSARVEAACSRSAAFCRSAHE
jgi:hypothetical protein